MDNYALAEENIVMKITHKKSGSVLGSNVIPATSFWRRLRGYMFYERPPVKFDGLYFPNCNIVHNSFVRFPLDVVFINKANTVIAIIRGFRPWRLSRMYLKAHHTLEFPAGVLPDTFYPGDQLLLEKE